LQYNTLEIEVEVRLQSRESGVLSVNIFDKGLAVGGALRGKIALLLSVHN
jgi:hypothetical protein